MAVVTKDDLLAKLKIKFGDAADDETLAIIEDVADTFDETWRKKYRDRFYSAVDEDAHDEDKIMQLSEQTDGDNEVIMTSYDDLFREEK